MSAEQLEMLAREATYCRECFSCFVINSATIDIAQPRWVGSSYWSTSPRISVVMINPGAGDDRTDAADANMRQLLTRFSSGHATLKDVFNEQRVDMPNWGKGKFWKFFVTQMALDLDQVAFANVAWCSTSGDDYPQGMLRHCMARFTRPLIKILAPDIVILSGAKTQKFSSEINIILPSSYVITTYHYANRFDANKMSAEIKRVKGLIRDRNSL